METQAISAPVERLTREAPKRQVGYGLPCAKCHKYFPADLEVCPICKGRERVSPIVAPKTKKPVQSETSATPSSTNHAVKQEVKESPRSESPALVPRVEVTVKDQPLEQREAIMIPVIAELPAAIEPECASLISPEPVSTPLVSTPKETEPPKAESLALAPPVEITLKEQPLDHKDAITTPAVAEIPSAVEPARPSLRSTRKKKETESPKLESPVFATPVEVHVVEVPAKDQPLTQKESITIPAVTEVQGPIESVADKTEIANDASLTNKTRSLTVTTLAAGSVEHPCVDQSREPIAIPALSEAPRCVAPVAENVAQVRDEELPKEPEAAAIFAAQQIPVEDSCLNDQSNNDQFNNDQLSQEEPIAMPLPVEVQACDPVPTAVAPTPKEEKLTTQSEAPAAAAPIHIVVEDQHLEEQRREKINEALRIVIPMLVEAQASDPAPVAEEQGVPEQEKKKVEVREMLETPPISASEAKIEELKIAEVKPVESPAVFDRNHRPAEEKTKAIGKDSDAAPKPADVKAPVVVHLNLGELSLTKYTPERAPASERFKEIERSEPETSSADTSSDVDTSETTAPVSGRRFDLVTFALGVVVLACAVLLITLAVLRLMPRQASEPVRRAKAAYNAEPIADQHISSSIPTPPPTAAASGNSAPSNSSPVGAPGPVPAQPPTASATNPSSASERVLALPPGLAEGNLLYRVEPDYPEEARRQGVQGPVVLDLHISKDGLVQGVDLVSGQPLLMQAATAAVKQWRFRTRYVNGNEVEMQTRITLHFALPTQ
ncbi:MAG: TonB family protein [Candidatus Sulfotelmatobacter sp.]